MSTLLRRKHADQHALSATERARVLAEALQTGGAELSDDAVAHARRAINQTRERTALVGGHTVVALAGATGSGKSSTFNALVGEDVSRVGARRPTTATATAAVWGDEPATPLLDWLGVGDRHQVGRQVAQQAAPQVGAAATEEGLAGPGALDGLVLLDLPDFDSRAEAHRQEADRVLQLADVFVWVTDPQKYADARLHDDYIRALAAHDAETVVVLNHADRLTPEGVDQCLADLHRLLVADGLPERTQVIATSARTGAGLDRLRARLAEAVASRTAAERRLTGDLRTSAEALREQVGSVDPQIPAEPGDELVSALGRAAGVPVVLEAVERDYRREAAQMTGWPFTRWGHALRPDPLKRLRLKEDNDLGIEATDVRRTIGRSSLPPPTPAARAAVDLATRRLADESSQGLPTPWAEAVQRAAAPEDNDLVDSLDQTVLAVPLRARRPMWWSVFNALQWLLAITAVAGLVWLLVLMGLGWAQLPVPDSPRLGILPYPLIMLVGGVLLGLLLAALGRPIARAGARRRRDGIGRRFHAAIYDVAQERLVAEVRDVLERHARTRQLLDQARVAP
ncbi:GTPase [Arsenicicoccus sp. oral taxon 190]|uniref:GTPase n=1 Tax=Arsenicicoccus sp. oral taxon 190 TaxID=1658671 RepID=UPI000679F49E|nr:GTPase [Arsenicicoccus sp. oral taxon 190]AKT51501.1 ABC transporter [Arsenicicoccus sp. oral taxon 190]